MKLLLILAFVGLMGCGVTSTHNGWSAGVGMCTGGWHVGQCQDAVK